MVGVKKVNFCNGIYYKLFDAVVNSDSSHIVIVIMHQLLVCNKFAFFQYYDLYLLKAFTGMQLFNVFKQFS